MFKVTKKVKSRKKAFFNDVNRGLKVSLDEMGIVGRDNIGKETPEDTGFLRASNNYQIIGMSLIFFNPLLYAPYVEFGTLYIYANPFMRRGINNSTYAFMQILIRNMGV